MSWSVTNEISISRRGNEPSLICRRKLLFLQTRPWRALERERSRFPRGTSRGWSSGESCTSFGALLPGTRCLTIRSAALRISQHAPGPSRTPLSITVWDSMMKGSSKHGHIHEYTTSKSVTSNAIQNTTPTPQEDLSVSDPGSLEAASNVNVESTEPQSFLLGPMVVRVLPNGMPIPGECPPPPVPFRCKSRNARH